MRPKTIGSVILLTLIFFAQEIWQLWISCNYTVNCWFALNYPLNVEWFYRFLGISIAGIFRASTFHRIAGKVPYLRRLSTVMLFYWIANLVLFFVCFNRGLFSRISLTVGLVSVLYLIVDSRKNKFKHLHLYFFAILSIVCLEFWQFFRYSTVVINPWISLDMPLSIQWFLKFLGLYLCNLFMDLSIYSSAKRVKKISSLKNIGIILSIYSIADIALYFINFNHAPYALVYATLGFVIAVVFLWREIIKTLTSFWKKTRNWFIDHYYRLLPK